MRRRPVQGGGRVGVNREVSTPFNHLPILSCLPVMKRDVKPQATRLTAWRRKALLRRLMLAFLRRALCWR